jgi:phosphatidylinositol 3-kinase
LTKVYPKDFQVGQAEPTPIQQSFMIKNGDDLRQDQFALQQIHVMDHLLKKAGMDLCFTIYKVVACTYEDGMMEFVPESQTVQQICFDHDYKVSAFLRKLADNSNGQLSFEQAQKNYVLSNAGYAVATYFLAVGDRHMENLLVRSNGCLFHCDFGFMFGKHPPKKGTWIPPIRINKHVVEGMGDQYATFKKTACEAFIELRKHRHFLLDLVMLMSHYDIKDLQVADCVKQLDEYNERFLPDLSDEDAF